MQLLISLSAVLCFSVLAGIWLLRLWLNYQRKNILNYDSGYNDDKDNIDKTPKRFCAVSIHNYSKMLFGFGLMVSSALVLLAFNWQTIEEQNLVSYEKPIMEEEIVDMPPLTDIPPPPPPKVQVFTSDFIEVDKLDFDDSLIEINLEDIEFDLDDIVKDVTRIDKNNFENEDVGGILEVVEEPAMFEGGMDNFYKYVAKNLNYPKQAKRQNIEGKIFLQFVVDKEGKLIDIKVIKGVGFGLDEEAKRVLKQCPKWQPARQRGKTVRVRMSIPIMFKLNK